jgi:hypothetical protein
MLISLLVRHSEQARQRVDELLINQCHENHENGAARCRVWHQSYRSRWARTRGGRKQHREYSLAPFILFLVSEAHYAQSK